MIARCEMKLACHGYDTGVKTRIMATNLLTQFKHTLLVCAAAFVCFAPTITTAAPGPEIKTKIINYNLAPGASTGPISIFPNFPVQVTGVCLTSGTRGVASATLLRIPGGFIEWVGLESASGSSITEGASSTPGDHILYLDFSHQVDIQVHSADAIMIHNASGGARSGRIVLTFTKP
jgi:hypothetical protein